MSRSRNFAIHLHDDFDFVFDQKLSSITGPGLLGDLAAKSGNSAIQRLPKLRGEMRRERIQQDEQRPHRGKRTSAAR